MGKKQSYKSLPVLLICDLDPAWPSRDREEVLRSAARLANCLRCRAHSVKLVTVPSPDLSAVLSEFDPAKYMVFNWCESLPGVKHSESMVVEIMERLNFTFTGSSSETLKLSADKYKISQILRKHGISSPRGRICRSAGEIRWNSYPAIVKAAFEHCSIGISFKSVVTSPAELSERIGCVVEEHDQPAIVEEFIDGREFQVSVWGDSRLEMLPPVEKDFSGISNIRERLCTYHAKFDTKSKAFNRINTVVPARLSGDELRKLRMVAIKTFRVIGCRDYARIDLRLRDGVFYVLDVNPNPDISIDCSMAFSAKAAGFSYGAMASRLISLAAARHPAFRVS